MTRTIWERDGYNITVHVSAAGTIAHIAGVGPATRNVSVCGRAQETEIAALLDLHGQLGDVMQAVTHAIDLLYRECK